MSSSLSAGEPKLLDFGLARSFGSAAAIDATATNTATTAGTVAYMSPEQARDEPLDARSDLFSLGATLYQIVTGALPFPGSSTALVFDAILNKPSRRPSQVNAAVSSPLEQILLRALEKDQRLRYQSAADLRADLQRLLRADSAAVPAAVRPPRPRWPLVVATAAIVVAGVLGYLFWRGQPEPQRGPLTLEQVTESGDVAAAAISDDGKYVVYAEAMKDGVALNVRDVQTKATVTIIQPGTHQFAGVTFSRDGAYVYATTMSPASLIRVPTLGGPPVKCSTTSPRPCPFRPTGVNWPSCARRTAKPSWSSRRRMARIRARSGSRSACRLARRPGRPMAILLRGPR